MGDRLVDPSSAQYQEFARLYAAAQRIRPSSIDRWNGELRAHDEEHWGGFNWKTGTMRLSESRVLDQLGPEADPDKQAQALATILHESKHPRTEIAAFDEPNAAHHPSSSMLDEGLIEHQTVRDFDRFLAETGYPPLELKEHEYKGAYAAADQLAQYAAGPEGNRNLVADKALETSLPMRFDSIADDIVRNRLSDVVPADPAHQQAARAALVIQMRDQNWAGLQGRPATSGELLGNDAVRAVAATAADIRQHYQRNPGQPYPTEAPNRHASATLPPSEQQRSGSASLQPAPAMPAEMRAAFAGQAPAQGAVQTKPDLGNGSRAQTGPGGPTKSIGPSKDPNDRGRD